MDSGKPYWAVVIGVVRDVDSAASVNDPSTAFQLYKPMVHEPWSNINVVVRSPTPAMLADSLRRAIAEVDADLAAADVGTVRQIVDHAQHNLVLAAKTLTGFALLGLLLASVGLYGVISNLVAQRTGEFGIRLALGAQPRDVLMLVLKHGLQLVAIGLLLGLGGAYGVGRLLGAIMPRIANPDAVTLLAVTVVLFVVALIACWLPARRATRVDPMIALRAE
jgi:ABC-type antimicrobial peptide transport system permease subunit